MYYYYTRISAGASRVGSTKMPSYLFFCTGLFFMCPYWGIDKKVCNDLAESLRCMLSLPPQTWSHHPCNNFENLQIWKCTIWKWSLLYARWLFLHFLGNILQPPLLAIGAGGEKGCSNMKRRTGSNKNAIFDTSYETHTTFHIPILRRKKNETITAGWNWIPCLKHLFLKSGGGKCIQIPSQDVPDCDKYPHHHSA